MHPLTRMATAALLCLAATTQAAPLHYLTLINRAHAAASTVEVAEHGSDDFHALVLAGPIEGGGGQATVALRETGCRLDLRFQFSDGRRARYSDTNVCRGDALVIAPLPAR